jgi:hypothetical protein
MSIWSSLNHPDDREARCADEDDCDEYGDRNPRDHVIDVATAFEQIRLCIWPARDSGKHWDTGTSVNVLLLPDDARALRDLLSLALGDTTGGDDRG